MDVDQTILTLIAISLILSVLSTVHIIRKAFMEFLPFIHITCLIGSLIVLALSILDLLIALKMVELSNNSSSVYFLSTSLTSILSSYILLQVGFNFYQDYNFIKTLLMFAPIVVSVGVFGVSVFIAIKMILNETNVLTEDDKKFVLATFILNAILSVFSLLYGIIPLFSIRSQTRLRPQQTAISIVHFSIVVVLFISHFIVYAIITFNGPISNMGDNAIQNMILILIFPGCLFSPPRTLVKFIKRRILGVEVLTIGGDFRPNMLPNDYANRSPSNIQFISVNDSINDSSSSSNTSSQILTSELSITSISSPNVIPKSNPAPNSASPKRNQLPIVRNNSLPSTYILNNPNPIFSRPRRNTFSTMNSTESDTSLYISKFINISPDNGFSRLSRLSRDKLKQYIIGGEEDIIY